MIHRQLSISHHNSLFIFGARGTGKSTYLKNKFPYHDPSILWINLLTEEDEDRFARHPDELSRILKQKDYKKVIIDEIQKAPKLLDIVHFEIEKKMERQFILTGSSARKLKRGAANLLAGRAFTYKLFPFTHVELERNFNLNDALRFGTLPQLHEFQSDEDKSDFLRSYTKTYLREEIQIEQLVRKLDPFKDFLEIMAQVNGHIIHYSKIANDIGVDHKTVSSYFQILEDTFLGFYLQPFHRSIRKRQQESPKFYLFDPGIKRALERSLSMDLIPQSSPFGLAFEHWIILECFRLDEYLKKDFRFSYLKTKDGAEIDLIIERPGHKEVLIEIKSTQHVRSTDVTSLNSFVSSWDRSCEAFVLSLDPHPKKFDHVNAVFWREGISQIFGLTPQV